MTDKRKRAAHYSAIFLAMLIAVALGCASTGVSQEVFVESVQELPMEAPRLSSEPELVEDAAVEVASVDVIVVVEVQKSQKQIAPEAPVEPMQAPSAIDDAIPAEDPIAPNVLPIVMAAEETPSNSEEASDSEPDATPALISVNDPTSAIALSLRSVTQGSSFSKGDPVVVSVMLSAGDHDVRGVEVALDYDPKAFTVTSLDSGNFLVDESFEFVEPVVGLEHIDDQMGVIRYAAAKVNDRPLSVKSGEFLRISGVANMEILADDNLLSLSSVRVAGASGDQIGFIVGGIELVGWK